jgi:hypothetical protein
MSTPRDILQFWFSDRARALWFEKDAAFDADISARFGPLVHQAQMGGFEDWRASPDSALALLLLLDQFARNIFRGQAKAFLGDPRAREIAAEAVARGFDQRGFSLGSASVPICAIKRGCGIGALQSAGLTHAALVEKDNIEMFRDGWIESRSVAVCACEACGARSACGDDEHAFAVTSCGENGKHHIHHACIL